TTSRCGFFGGGMSIAPYRPGWPGSPPARCTISIATCHMSVAQPAWMPTCDWLKPNRSPLLMAPYVGFSAQLAQKLAGLRTEPISCVPIATGTMPAPTAAPEPLEEPPGVRFSSNGFVVGPGSRKPNAVVTVLPRIMAPASHSALT